MNTYLLNKSIPILQTLKRSDCSNKSVFLKALNCLCQIAHPGHAAILFNIWLLFLTAKYDLIVILSLRRPVFSYFAFLYYFLIRGYDVITPHFFHFYTPEVKLRTYYGMASVRMYVRPLATSCPLNILKSYWMTVMVLGRKIGLGQ